ncbi:MAG: AAA family ATPase [Gammaproteobacteria bacterium]|nr:AAA family ATPase [Gammaproteobacteria bacterium]
MNILPSHGRADHAPVTLRCDAFEENHDTRFYFASKRHAHAVGSLQRFVEERRPGFAVLTGEVGCGKTITRAVLQELLVHKGCLVVEVENSMLDFDGLLLEIISQVRNCRVNPTTLPDRYARLVEFKNALSECVIEKDSYLVLILDEAQQLSPDTLEGLRALTNIVAERIHFMSVILLGQPELNLTLDAMRAVKSRIDTQVHLEPLEPAEMLRYLVHRMGFAGLQVSPPFTVDSLSMLGRLSEGVPRDINRICRGALDVAVEERLVWLDANLVHRIAMRSVSDAPLAQLDVN